MKKSLFTMLILFVGCFGAGARDVPHNIRIDSLHTAVTGERLDMRCRVHADSLRLEPDARIKVEFAVENGGRRLILPAVIYSGKTRYRYEQRRRLLSGRAFAQPYRDYKCAKKRRDYSLDYTLSVPYRPWMEHASVTYRICAYDCAGETIADSGLLVADLNPAVRPDSTLFALLPCFLAPDPEVVGARTSMIGLNVEFPVNVTDVRPDFGANRRELMRVDSLLHALQNHKLVRIDSVSIRGYASPEGGYGSNERLAKGRSEKFKRYLVERYADSRFVADASVSWIAEDWDGFAKLVEAEPAIAQKQKVLAIIRDGSVTPDAKDRMLQQTGRWTDDYRFILRELYPRLRRIEMKVDFTVDDLTDAGQNPDSPVANHNAAASLLREGRATEAAPYLDKCDRNGHWWINYGAYHYILGDRDKALECFVRAREAGVEQAAENIRLVTSTRKP